MLNFDFLESSSHAVLDEFREARVAEVVLPILPFELDFVVLRDFDRQSPRHTVESSVLHISCHLAQGERRQGRLGVRMAVDAKPRKLSMG